MGLDEYLKKNGISGPQFAVMIGVDPSSVYRIRTGQVLPHRRTMKAIFEATGGLVTHGDLAAVAADGVRDSTGALRAQTREEDQT